MNKEILKKSLIQSIPLGLVAALVLILARTLIGGTGFLSNLASLYGILTLICFPAGFTAITYNNLAKKEK